ncbi:hypothetical protein JCM10213_005497 [Rhodosporidiobolus nylandii]
MLDTIPSELLDAILDYLPVPSDSDLARYCLVSRALLPPARRRLYRQLKVILVARSHGIVRQHAWDRRGVWQPDASTLNLLATLEAHPHLRGLPRSVAVEAQRPFTTVSSQCPAAVNVFRRVLTLCPEVDSLEMLSPGPSALLRSLLDDATPRKFRHLGLVRLGDEEWELLRQQDSLSRLDLDLASRFEPTPLDPPPSLSFHLTHLTIDFPSLVGPEARAAPEQQHQAPLLFFGALLRSSFATLRTLHLTLDIYDFPHLSSFPHLHTLHWITGLTDPDPDAAGPFISSISTCVSLRTLSVTPFTDPVERDVVKLQPQFVSPDADGLAVALPPSLLTLTLATPMRPAVVSAFLAALEPSSRLRRFAFKSGPPEPGGTQQSLLWFFGSQGRPKGSVGGGGG